MISILLLLFTFIRYKQTLWKFRQRTKKKWVWASKEKEAKGKEENPHKGAMKLVMLRKRSQGYLLWFTCKQTTFTMRKSVSQWRVAKNKDAKNDLFIYLFIWWFILSSVIFFISNLSKNSNYYFCIKYIKKLIHF